MMGTVLSQIINALAYRTVKEIVMTKPRVAVSTMDAIHGRRLVRAYLWG